MNIEWDTNWAPTIVSMVGGFLLSLLIIFLQRTFSAKKRPHSENISAISPEGTTNKFTGVKTYSRRRVETDPSGSKKLTEEVIQFWSSEEGSSIIKTADIDIEASKSLRIKKP